MHPCFLTRISVLVLIIDYWLCPRAYFEIILQLRNFKYILNIIGENKHYFQKEIYLGVSKQKKSEEKKSLQVDLLNLIIWVEKVFFQMNISQFSFHLVITKLSIDWER